MDIRDITKSWMHTNISIKQKDKKIMHDLYLNWYIEFYCFKRRSFSMKRFPIEVHLTEFITNGTFGFLKTGMTKEEIEAQFFPPEGWLEGKAKEISSVWRYGNFELHFDNQKLVRIFNDYIDELDGGESIRLLDPWILSKGYKPTLETTMKNLNSINLDFARLWNVPDIVTLSLRNSKVHLSFHKPDSEDPDLKVDFNEYVLGAIHRA
jgi:hypothetical protein